MPTSCCASCSTIPGIADARLQQSTHYPEFRVDVDRTRADELGITERDVTNTLATTLAGSFQTAPAFWLNPKNGVSYPIVDPDARNRTSTRCPSCENIPVTARQAAATCRCWAASARSRREHSDAVVSHYDDPAVVRPLRHHPGPRPRRRRRPTIQTV